MSVVDVGREYLGRCKNGVSLVDVRELFVMIRDLFATLADKM